MPGLTPLNSNSRVTGLVTPLSVNSPSSAYLSPLGRTPVEVKVAVGNFSTSKKSGALMWASRCSLPLLTESTAISAVTDGVPSSADHDWRR